MDILKFDTILFIRMGAKSKEVGNLVKQFQQLINAGYTDEKATERLVEEYKYKFIMPDDVVEKLRQAGFSKLESVRIDLAYENFKSTGQDPRKLYEILKIDEKIKEKVSKEVGKRIAEPVKPVVKEIPKKESKKVLPKEPKKELPKKQPKAHKYQMELTMHILLDLSRLQPKFHRKGCLVLSYLQQLQFQNQIILLYASM